MKPLFILDTIVLKQTTVKIPPPIAGTDRSIILVPFNLSVFRSY